MSVVGIAQHLLQLAETATPNNAQFTEACTPEAIRALAQAVIDHEAAASRYRAAVDLGLLDEDELDEHLSDVEDILIDAIKAVTPKT